MKRLLLVLLWGALSIAGFAQSGQESVIKQILDQQTASWNKGDLNAFMQTYWKSDSLVFVGKNGVTYGWQNTLDNYKKGYPDKTAMGQLRFTIIRIEYLSNQVYNVIGKWQLTRTIGNLQGHYTLLIRKISGKWLIVQDHSS
ncbi:nuclear transport factor 2 family protein [Niabella yanshanensis]|uniref:Nuclear transport factor 2 family protein n=1 Tax=Niabella yanshanensis TaxID=577386 RepID=A0ABZ0W2V7_9BACT|nr:nuclear transport factor 2 family protein [Niabella yanshanensis]WQD36435.1 nuclear transport factor 2 family protein [Niabella yanshanensis]